MARHKQSPVVDAVPVTVPRSEPGPSANEAKPYPFRPSWADITRFLEHITATGQPETFPTICRTPPPADSRPVFLHRFSVERKKRPDGDEAPCAICSPFLPKFLHEGYLVWYPDEGVIRAIGPECGDAFFGGDQYAVARREYDLKRREDDALQFLEDNLPKVAGMVAAIMKIQGAAYHAGVLHSAFKRQAPIIQSMLRGVRRSGGTLKVTVVKARPPLEDDEDDDRAEGPRGLGRGGIDYYDEVVGQLPDSPMLNERFSPQKEWDELYELVNSLPKTSDAQEAYYWVADNAEGVDQMEAVVDRLRECAAAYVRLAERLDRVLRFLSVPMFRLLDTWGGHRDNPFHMSATTDGSTFTLERDQLVDRGYQYREKERMVLRPDFEKLHARGDWPGLKTAEKRA